MIPRRLIIAARHALGLTQAQLARELGISTSHLGGVESGHGRFSEALDAKVARIIERALRAAPLPVEQCPHGHALDAANTYVHEGVRRCRACHRETNRAWTRAKRSEAA